MQFRHLLLKEFDLPNAAFNLMQLLNTALMSVHRESVKKTLPNMQQCLFVNYVFNLRITTYI